MVYPLSRIDLFIQLIFGYGVHPLRFGPSGLDSSFFLPSFTGLDMEYVAASQLKGNATLIELHMV